MKGFTYPATLDTERCTLTTRAGVWIPDEPLPRLDHGVDVVVERIATDGEARWLVYRLICGVWWQVTGSWMSRVSAARYGPVTSVACPVTWLPLRALLHLAMQPRPESADVDDSAEQELGVAV